MLKAFVILFLKCLVEYKALYSKEYKYIYFKIIFRARGSADGH